ncbi:MAG: hypothetical protein HFJ20_03265 [Clostridia bacterium]|nr:hypothetical protein [Clostridia bacterium]
MNNKTLGNNFEKEYAKILSNKGYWVTFLTPKQNVGSQPCDLIAIKDDKPILIDCKTCNTHLFPIKRIEENQKQAFKRYSKCGNTRFILAIKYDNKIYEINIKDIDFKQKNIDLEGRTYEDCC